MVTGDLSRITKMNNHQVEPKAITRLREVLAEQSSHYPSEFRGIQRMSDSELVAHAAEELDRLHHFYHNE